MSNYEEQDNREQSSDQTGSQIASELKDQALKQTKKAIQNKNSPAEGKNISPNNASTTNGNNTPGQNPTPKGTTGQNNLNQSINAGNMGSSTASGIGASTGSSAAVGTSAGVSAGATGSAVAGGTSAGASAGPIGAAIGAAVGVGKEALDTVSGGKTQMEIEAKITKKATTSTTPDYLPIIIMIAGIPAFSLFFILLIAYSTISLTAAPVLALYNGVRSGWERVSGFFDEIGIDMPSYEEVVANTREHINKAMENAYLKVCYNEVYQIATEKGYDMDYTIESYNDTEFPHYFEEENSNINYAEILGLFSLREDMNYENFNYDKFKEILNDTEFQRTLYDLLVEEKQGIKATSVPEGATVERNGRQELTIKFEDGTTLHCTVENPSDYCEIVTYGEVTVGKYVLKKMYDYLGIDPFAPNAYIPSMTNHQLLSLYDGTSRTYNDTFWGNSERSSLFNYELYTGKITDNRENIYYKDLKNEPIFTETYINMDVTEYKQYDSKWASRPYGSGTMKSLGCCVTAVAMVCNYFNDFLITPDTIMDYLDENFRGELYSEATMEAFGVPSYNKTYDINIQTMIGELKLERLIIAHIAPYTKGTRQYGHYVVISGYEVIDGTGYFHIKEPANRLESTVSIAEASVIFDSYVSCGKS